MNFSLYSSAQEENIFIRKQARTWNRSGLITDDQLSTITNLTDPDLQQTNSFFRILFFVFTLLCAGALVGLFAWLMKSAGDKLLASIFIFFGAVYYILADYIVSKSKFYRYGIEEGLVLIAMGLFCTGCGWLLFKYGLSSKEVTIAVSALVAITAFLIYQRFGYLYAVLISLIAVYIIPFHLSLTQSGERVMLLIILCLILFMNIIYDKPEIEDFKRVRQTTIQAYILIALYLTVNWRVLGLPAYIESAAGSLQPDPKLFPPYIYWPSYVLTFVIPALGIYWGIKSRKRLILNASLVLACLTLATNKSYLGLTRYAWDSAIMGIMLISISIIISRWLKRGPDENRYGFTQSDILKPEDHGISLSDVAAALTPGAVGAQQPPAQPEKYFDGGSFGGGGASRNF